jgi:hypothetical protein
MDQIDAKIHWNEQLEDLLSKEGERALCFSWLHTHSQKRFTKCDTYIALPVIIMSTIAGTGSIASPSLFSSSQTASVIIGLISLTVGILNTISNYFSFAKRSESHRIAGITYSKIHKFILIELSLPRKERMKASDALKVIREQLERLGEISPQIPDEIIKQFNLKFEDTTPNISKPEITNGLDPIKIYVENSEILTPTPSTKIATTLKVEPVLYDDN